MARNCRLSPFPVTGKVRGILHRYPNVACAILPATDRPQLGYWSYNYPGSKSELDYSEIYITPSYNRGNIRVSPSFWYAGNYFGDYFLGGVSSLAYEVTISAEFQRDISLSGRIGEQTFDSSFDYLDYTHWDFGNGKSQNDFNFDHRWYDNDGVNPFLASRKLSDGNLVFSITRNS